MRADNGIRRVFSKAAADYDKNAFIQQRICREFIDSQFFKGASFGMALDVGTGTAGMINEISRNFPGSRIIGLDFALGMLKEAKTNGVKLLVQADGQHFPFTGSAFDLIVSNLAYQWIVDLDGAFSEAMRILKPNGLFCISLFGKTTLWQLRECISKVKNTAFIKTLPSEEEIRNKLERAGFGAIDTAASVENEQFYDIFELLRWLKILGVNKAGLKFSALEARGLLKLAGKLYMEKFKTGDKISASFEKIFVRAVKPDR
ncbi:MAG: hypothetical protein COV72_08505 [Candidatus Omnitrophica bacterium CG11_big_fil_rev_8_21_14_0_20_42_13]|uniref:Methyltransferase type 11 domain-containing protein n=1 Tax=Candidatus Ghiorseimicrobium undicola TaxID=1974746 RepID=A0A2H0LVB2_9BACT|nr:MAG: hypothetical protein COV72_08505 [Candidatus Omnitrophica bacterium CG11_big_fil_rev_8_21_14_0_20_42_13]